MASNLGRSSRAYPQFIKRSEFFTLSSGISVLTLFVHVDARSYGVALRFMEGVSFARSW